MHQNAQLGEIVTLVTFSLTKQARMAKLHTIAYLHGTLKRAQFELIRMLGCRPSCAKAVIMHQNAQLAEIVTLVTFSLTKQTRMAKLHTIAYSYGTLKRAKFKHNRLLGCRLSCDKAVIKHQNAQLG